MSKKTFRYSKIRIMVKKIGKVNFFRKNLRIQFDVVCDSESNSVIFDSLVPFGGELWPISYGGTYDDVKI